MPKEIVLSTSNPYSYNGQYLRFVETNEEELYREPLSYQITGKEQNYTISKDDRMDSIAKRFYQNVVQNPQNYVWLIAEVNQIDNYLDLSKFVGQTIIIPDVLQL